MQDVLKIAGGVFLGMMAFWIVTVALPAVMPPSAGERAAQDLLDRQFAPANWAGPCGPRIQSAV